MDLQAIVTNPAKSKSYFATITGVFPSSLVLPNTISGQPLQQSINLLSRAMGFDIGKVETSKLELVDKDANHKKFTFKLPSDTQSDGNQSFLGPMLRSQNIGGESISRGGTRGRLMSLLSTPYGLGALSLVDMSPTAARTVAHAICRNRYNVKVALSSHSKNRAPLMPGSPVSFRADFANPGQESIKTSVDVSDCSSILDSFSRLVYASSFDAALHNQFREAFAVPRDELIQHLKSTKDSFAGYFNRAFSNSICLAYQSVLLSCNELLDRGAVLSDNNEPRLHSLHEDINRFGDGGFRMLTKELGTRAIIWNSNNPNADLSVIRESHILSHLYTDGVEALADKFRHKDIQTLSSVNAQLSSQFQMRAARVDDYAYKAQSTKDRAAPKQSRPLQAPRPN
jgi:hypothetical protein